MSLASDILKRAFGQVEPPAPKRTAETKPPKEPKKPKTPATLEHSKRGVYLTCAEREFYGVFFDKKMGKYRARIKAAAGDINLGAFETPHRAAVAVQLYLLWFRRGFIEIPTGKNLT